MSDHKDFDLGKIHGNKKASLEGLVEQNESNRISEIFKAKGF